MKKILHFFSLFGSLSTLFCCALPFTLVSLGMGAVFVSLTSSFPQILWLAEHKDFIFLMTAIFLILSYFSIKKASIVECPINEKKEACHSSKKISQKFFWVIVSIYALGFTFSYLLPLMMS